MELTCGPRRSTFLGAKMEFCPTKHDSGVSEVNAPCSLLTNSYLCLSVPLTQFNGPLKLDTELRQIKTLHFVVEYGKDISAGGVGKEV